jgi:hypothetical protein
LAIRDLDNHRLENAAIYGILGRVGHGAAAVSLATGISHFMSSL